MPRVNSYWWLIWEGHELPIVQLFFWEILNLILIGKGSQQEQRRNKLGVPLLGRVLLHFILVASFIFHKNLMLREGNSPGHAPKSQTFRCFGPGTWGMNLVLLSTGDDRIYLHHIRYEVTVSSKSTWLGYLMPSRYRVLLWGARKCLAMVFEDGDKSHGHQFEDCFPVLWGLHFVPRISSSLGLFLFWGWSWTLLSLFYSSTQVFFTYLYLPAGTTGEASAQLSVFTEQDQEMKELEDLIIQLQSIKYEQIELCGFMTNYHYKGLNNR